MKVLMLGWEFPPHISGGLGTACFGLTKGLAHNGVQVTFVVPKLYGDEDARALDLVSAESIRVPRGAVPRDVEAQPLAALERDSGAAAPSGSLPELPEMYSHLRELLVVASPLRPYLDEHTFRRLVTLESRVRAGRARSGHQAASGAGTSATAIETPPEIEREPDSVCFSFSGHYGPDLFSEVARYALAVAELARERDFDVIHAHDWMTYPAGLLAKATSGKPCVLHLHACEYDRSGEDVNVRIRDIEQAGFDGADRIVTVSHYMSGVARRRYRIDKSRVRVVHNAVTHAEQADRLHVTKTIGEKIVLFLGRVTFQKGPDYFIDAARLVVNVEPRVKFVVSGSGDMLPSIVERVARLGLSRHVHFTGFLRGRDVERMYALADLYVMPSVSEPFGISPLEAMSLDTPVIVSRQSGVAEILRNALRVDFWDVRGMANKILACLRREGLVRQLVEEGREEVRLLRWEQQGRHMLEIYKELVP
jgi:glycosyltransferase involved in cell wall biosynthesis